METLRADDEMAGRIIHKPMFERLILCEYAVADPTTANANVFYELGIRHAVATGARSTLRRAIASTLRCGSSPSRTVPIISWRVTCRHREYS
jgi:hypothetical protein